MIFPSTIAKPLLSNDLAAAGAYAMLYVDAVVPDHVTARPAGTYVVRPSTVLWLSEDLAARTDAATREAYRKAALSSKRKVEALAKSLGLDTDHWYGDNTRETLRDEIIPGWRDEGALWVDPAVPTTSSAARYALTESFAALFDPSLRGTALADAIAAWAKSNASPVTKTRRAHASVLSHHKVAVVVTLPDGATTRTLETGGSSLIIKALIEQWATKYLASPLVIAIAESKTKVHLADSAVLAGLGLSIDKTKMVVDVILADVASSVTYWFIEIVNSDGPIDEARKGKILAWAAEHSIAPDSCAFLSAFHSRTHAATKKRIADIAVGTHLWFADEPDLEVELRQATKRN